MWHNRNNICYFKIIFRRFCWLISAVSKFVKLVAMVIHVKIAQYFKITLICKFLWTFLTIRTFDLGQKSKICLHHNRHIVEFRLCAWIIMVGQIVFDFHCLFNSYFNHLPRNFWLVYSFSSNDLLFKKINKGVVFSTPLIVGTLVNK